MAKFVKLFYSEKQLSVCMDIDIEFVPNLCLGQEYTEMRTGKTLEECKSFFPDAVCVFYGSIEDYEKLVHENQIVYRKNRIKTMNEFEQDILKMLQHVAKKEPFSIEFLDAVAAFEQQDDPHAEIKAQYASDVETCKRILDLEAWQLQQLQQLEQDIANYGDKAYLLWEYREGYDFEKISQFDNYLQVSNGLTMGYPEIYRKESAELPFDIDRAKAGDEVMVMVFGRLIDFDFLKWIKNGDTQLENIEFSYPSDLTMKYPPKVVKNDFAELNDCQAVANAFEEILRVDL